MLVRASDRGIGISFGIPLARLFGIVYPSSIKTRGMGPRGETGDEDERDH